MQSLQLMNVCIYLKLQKWGIIMWSIVSCSVEIEYTVNMFINWHLTTLNVNWSSWPYICVQFWPYCYKYLILLFFSSLSIDTYEVHNFFPLFNNFLVLLLITSELYCNIFLAIYYKKPSLSWLYCQVFKFLILFDLLDANIWSQLFKAYCRQYFFGNHVFPLHSILFL